MKRILVFMLLPLFSLAACGQRDDGTSEQNLRIVEVGSTSNLAPDDFVRTRNRAIAFLSKLLDVNETPRAKEAREAYRLVMRKASQTAKDREEYIALWRAAQSDWQKARAQLDAEVEKLRTKHAEFLKQYNAAFEALVNDCQLTQGNCAHSVRVMNDLLDKNSTLVPQ